MNCTVFTVFVLPFLIGSMIRLLFLKWKRGYLLTGIFALVTVIIWFWTHHLVNHGVDGTVMIWALMAGEFTVGSMMVGGVSMLRNKHQNK